MRNFIGIILALLLALTISQMTYAQEEGRVDKLPFTIIPKELQDHWAVEKKFIKGKEYTPSANKENIPSTDAASFNYIIIENNIVKIDHLICNVNSVGASYVEEAPHKFYSEITSIESYFEKAGSKVKLLNLNCNSLTISAGFDASQSALFFITNNDKFDPKYSNTIVNELNIYQFSADPNTLLISSYTRPSEPNENPNITLVLRRNIQ